MTMRCLGVAFGTALRGMWLSSMKSKFLTLRNISCMNPCMATKTISLELDAYERLRRAKREGESFSGVVRRAKFGPADARGSSILAALGDLPAHASDEEAVRFFDGCGVMERTASSSPWKGEEAP